MKIKKCHLILTVAIGILCVPTLSQTELLPPEDRPFLIGRAHPELTQIEQLYIDLHPETSVSHIDIRTLEDIHKKIESRLDNANINIISRLFLDSRPIFSLTDVNPLHLAKLRVDIGTLKLEKSQQYVFRIQISLAAKVYLTKPSTWLIEADVWKANPVMQTVSIKDMPTEITNTVLEQVENFILAYKEANKPAQQSSKIDTNTTDSLTAAEKQIKPTIKSTVSEYKYVASKNSTVFHKPQCRSAKRINQENLVGYNNRQSAIKSGRRPCKTCKP